MRELTLRVEGSDHGIERLVEMMRGQSENPILLIRVQGVEYADSAHQVRVLDAGVLP